MYGLLRLIFIGVLLLMSWLFLARFEKTTRIIALALVIIIGFATWFIPVENLFVTFSEPSQAFQYVYSASVQNVVYAEESAFIVGADGNKKILAIVPRMGHNWGISLGHQTELIHTLFDNGFLANIYRFSKTGEYYIVVNSTTTIQSIQDSFGSSFVSCSEPGITSEFVEHTMCAYLKGYDYPYILQVNGTEYVFSHVTQ